MTRINRVVAAALSTVAVLCTTAWLGAQGSSLTPTADALYADASAKETAVRKVLAASKPPATVLRAVRTVVLDYEAIVRRYPSSGYCDDALWRAALLASDAFRAFGDAREQTSATKLLQLMSSQYPSSKYVRQAPALVAELSMLPVRAPLTPDPVQRDADATTAATAPPALAPPVASSPTPALTAVRPASIEPPAAGETMLAGALTVARRSEQGPRTTSSQRATISDIRRVPLSDVVRVIIELDREVSFRDDRLDNPSRVFVDLPGTEPARGLKDQTLRFDGDSDLVRQIRLGRHPNNITRVVLEAEGVSSYSVYTLYNPFRLVIDSSRANASLPAPTPVPSVVLPPLPPPSVLLPLPTRRLETWAHAFSNVAPVSERIIREAKIADPEPLPATTTTAPVATEVPALAPAVTFGAAVPIVIGPVAAIEPPSRMLSGGLSLARQLGLRVSRIVIDPGHGGHDPGAKGGGSNEADLVLDVALRLEKLLQGNPDMEVVLTRRTNDFVPLQERTAIANREGADLFLSIHANSSTVSSARGVETYFLNFANNLGAAATAARENAASGQSMGELPDVVRTIALNNKLDESRDLATYVQREMVSRLRASNKSMRDLGVKQAPFQVLIGAAMPSILAEVAFLSNPQEAKLVKQSAYRQRIAEALFAAVRKYQGSLAHVGSIALQ